MTERENYLRVVRDHEVPEWLPRIQHCTMGCGPSYLNARRTPDGGGYDIFGVRYIATKDTGGMALPVPNEFILEDITEWRDVIKLPNPHDYDWEAMAKEYYSKVDRNERAISLFTTGGIFLNLMNFMGFTEGLCAMFEEPDEVMELFEYTTNFVVENTKLGLQYYKPDQITIADDIATANDPFVSPQMYRDMVKPFHKRIADLALDAGIPVNMHCCGHCESLIEDWRDIGVSIWEPAQVSNDLLAIKKKYGRELTLVGCWDSQGPVAWPEATEEEVKSAVRECIDTYAPDGGFVFWASAYGAEDDIPMQNKIRWLEEEYNDYGRKYYATH